MKSLRLCLISLAIVTVFALSATFVHAEYHHVEDCSVCHYAGGADASACNDSANLMYVRDLMEHPPGSDPRPTVFEPYVTNEGPFNGICQICHTAPNVRYYLNDGLGDPHPEYTIGEITGGPPGTACTLCHTHSAEFSHTGSLPCESCHGQDGGAGTSQSHSTHTENDSDDLKGPHAACPDCHDTSSYPDFADGATTLAATTACDTCHSQGGSDNGVAMAKANWVDGVYEEDGITLKSGKEKWCASCHDEQPANSRNDGTGINAPKVLGDGATYGYYTTGHGAEGAVECLSCHDASWDHIDHEHRTYTNGQDNYQAGYRLKSVNGWEPLYIPRPTNDPAPNWLYYALCFSCHIQGEVLGDGSMTNFVTNNRSGNSHDLHLDSYNIRYDSDWDGYQDSMASCTTCHNVHGTPNQAMVRHGELISTYGTTDKVPAFNLGYVLPPWPPGTWDPEAPLEESIGGSMDCYFGHTSYVVDNGVCTGCHGRPTSYRRSPYLVTSPKASPHVVHSDGVTEVLLTSRVFVRSGTVSSVTIDLAPIHGAPSEPMYDDGTHGDVTPGDSIYSCTTVVPDTVASGLKGLVLTATIDGSQVQGEVRLAVIAPGEIGWDNGGQDTNWSTPENWYPDGVPGPGDNVVVFDNNGSICIVDIPVSGLASFTLDASYKGAVILNHDFEAAELSVDSGAILCKGDPTVINAASGGTIGTPHGAGIIITATNVTVASEAKIHADGQGFPQGQGPEPGYTGHESAGGAGHGGSGGHGVNSGGGSTYGSVSEPTALGSGGVVSYGGHVAGPGGGAIKLDVSDTLTIHGTVSANGGNSTQYGAGGAGGSIWLVVHTLSGSGAITADGGSSSSTNKSGGGGGGRIALDWTARTFDGVIKAKGGSGYRHGKHGTIWVPSTKWTELWNATYHVNGDIAIVVDASDASLPSQYTFGDLIIDSGVTLECQGDRAAINGPSGGTAGDPHGAGAIIHATNITVEGTLSASGLGFSQGQGPEPGYTGHESAGGAGHGGGGGHGPNSRAGAPYGSVSEPTALGSGGVVSYGGHVGGPGGGAIKLNVSNTLTINGTVSANGGSSSQYGAGGAGGSIWLVVHTLSGSGAITADGGSSSSTNKSGGGGGGRIALDWTTRTFDGLIRAKSGSGYRYGKHGTIWVPSTKWTELWNATYHVNGDIAIVVDASDASLPVEYTFGDLVIDSGVTLECQGDRVAINGPSGGTAGDPHGAGAIIHATNITVEGTLSASGLGFSQGQGPEPGYTGHESAGGAGHGGGGGHGPNSKAGATYGSVSEPTALGSGGVVSYGGHAGGLGGGAIKLDVSNTLTITGTISANGGSSTQYGAGGAGGSIWLVVHTLAGSGAITADGGSSNSTAKSGGGGGGRIALDWTTRTFDGVIKATGGSGYRYGKHGTIWVPSTRWTELWNATYHVNGDIAIVVDASDASLPSQYTFGDLIIDSGVTLECQGDTAAINAPSGGTAGDPHGAGAIINATDITVEGALSASGLGFSQGQGPEPGYTGHESAGGAGHGGGGGNGPSSSGGATYGLVGQPTALGSGGVVSYGGHAGGIGGGAIKLDVSNTLTINGTVSANGGSSTQYGAGGAGGSLWLFTDTLSGSGAITADGGSSNSTAKSGGGGGGRIAVYFSVDTSSITQTVSGGTGYDNGEPGTLVWE
ncbi:MAG: choice-of-anchor X domain-containing protein [Thermodesulfobacteriota bacterium]|nr:choice-of-anchor X domain-containing protein [Thermodesulfobacteriota bacterium]